MNTSRETALTFPCEFPIKAVGHAEADFASLVVNIIGRHYADLCDEAVRTRPSRNGKYVAVTITIQASSREQLDAIYLDLTACDQVLMAL